MFMIGSDYIRHDGGGPDINKGVMTVDSVNFNYTGAGFWQNVNFTDVIFQPLAARQNLNSRQFDIQTAKNDVLFQTADTYFLVHQYRGMYAGALYAVERGHDLVERISQMSKDLVPADEVDRARNVLADLQQQATSARELWRLHSADLTQVLRLDPRTVVVPMEHDHLQITLIDPDQPLKDLIRIAVNNRPEIASRRALVLAAEANVSREKWRPVLPVFMLNGFQSAGMYLQAGIFGLGPNSSLNHWFGRDDVSFQFIWQLDGMGVGNLARIKQQRGQQSQAIIDLFHWQDQVAADVNRALAHLQSSTARVSQADRALRTAIITFNGNFEGLRQTTRFEDVLVLVIPAAGSGLLTRAHEVGLRRILHHGRRIQPGAVRVVPRPGLPRRRTRQPSASRRDRASEHGPAHLSATGRQWAAPGDSLRHLPWLEINRVNRRKRPAEWRFRRTPGARDTAPEACRSVDRHDGSVGGADLSRQVRPRNSGCFRPRQRPRWPDWSWPA